jgi:putative Holliday junction resolvase
MTPPSPSPQRHSGRILAIDPGEKRIGVAAADLGTGVAVPVRTIEAGGDPVEAVVRVAEEQGAQAIVVGLALSLSGALGPQAQDAQALADALARRLDIPIHTWDERLTSTEARRRLARPEGRASARGKRRPKGDVDALAATIILQAYLDGRRRAAPG